MRSAARLVLLAFAALSLSVAPASPASAGSIDDYFDGCKDDWLRTQGPLGSYTLVVCDQGVLDRFFDSGLERYGPEQLRILDPRDPPPDPYGLEEKDALSIPVRLETKDKAEWSRAIITNKARARPYVYAAAQLIDGSVIEALFPPVRMKPRSRWTLRRGRYVWRLVDRRGATVARARRVHRDIPPLNKPVDVSASRQAGVLTVSWLSYKQPIGTAFRVYGARQLGGPWQLLAAFDADGGGGDVTRRFPQSDGIGVVRVEATRGSRYESAEPVTVEQR